MDKSLKNVQVDKKNNSFYNISGKDYCLKAQILPPDIVGESKIHLDFKKPSLKNIKIGNLKGSVQIDVSNTSGLEVKREIFLSDDGKYTAIRMSLKNNRPESIKLHTLCPFKAEGGDSVSIGKTSFTDWRVLRMCRNKNDMPGVFHPSRIDEAHEDVVFSTEKVVAGGGITPENEKSIGMDFSNIQSEPLIIIKDTRDNNLPGLFIGMMGQTSHLTQINLTPSIDRKELKKLDIVCEFDDIVVDKGEEVYTHWILLFEGIHEGEMLKVYADILADMHNIPLPGNPIATYCSWYFYGIQFTEKDLEDEVNAIKEKKVPFDAFIIDNGWMHSYGEWDSNERFPSGMKAAADKIRAAGMIPGIWTCPFIVTPPISDKYPDLIAFEKDGKPATLSTIDKKSFVIDPSSDFTKQYVTDLFKKLKSWGYYYHKLDYLRYMSINENIRFRDPKMNRAKAYYAILKIIRDALGKDCYMSGCGGIYDAANLGVLDSYRNSADVRGRWNEPGNYRKYGALIKIKQNVMRSYANRFWNTDPDATMIRVRNKPYKADETMRNHCYLSEGSFTDDEAFSIITNQYLGGGNVCVSERFADLQDSRLALLRHIMPISAPPAKILDYEETVCPTLFLTEIKPKCANLGNWWNLTVANWGDSSKTRDVKLPLITQADGINKYVVFEFYTQKFLGVKTPEDILKIDIPAHGVRVLRIAPWDGKSPVLIGTDLHLTGGACEISECKISESSISGKIKTPWHVPVTITAGFKDGKDGIKVVNTKMFSDGADFLINK